MTSHEIPHLPIKVKLDEAREIIQGELDANEWVEVEIPTPSLEMKPFFFFHFDTFVEVEAEGSKSKNVDETTQGISSLNAVSNELDEVVAELVSPENIQSKLKSPVSVSVSIAEPRFLLDEAKVAAQIKIAAQEKVPKSNVQISGMRLVYVPFWVYGIKLEEDTEVKLWMNAVSGEFVGDDSGVPYRGKTRTQVLKETITGLQSASGWIENLQDFFGQFLLVFQPNREHPNRWLYIAILVLIAIVLLGIGFIRLPV
ncbi:MAG: hypothetical protein V1776_03455 [Candidatus Diapherotrites archaeon]